MIEYRIKEPDIFIKCLKSLSIAGEYFLLRFGNGLTTFGKDPGGIYLYYAEFGESIIDIVKDGKIDVFISLGDVSKILKRFSSVEDFTIIYDDNKIIFKIKADNRRKTFVIYILDEEIEMELKDRLANMKLNTMFTINGADLLDAIQDTEIYSEICDLQTIDSIVRLNTYGHAGEVESDIEIDTPATENTKACYSLNYMKLIVNTMADDDIIVAYDKGMPIMLHKKISNDSYLKWYLAPRVEQDD